MPEEQPLGITGPKEGNRNSTASNSMAHPLVSHLDLVSLVNQDSRRTVNSNSPASMDNSPGRVNTDNNPGRVNTDNSQVTVNNNNLASTANNPDNSTPSTGNSPGRDSTASSLNKDNTGNNHRLGSMALLPPDLPVLAV